MECPSKTTLTLTNHEAIKERVRYSGLPTSVEICKGQAIQKVRKGEYFQVWKTNVPGYEATEGTERRLGRTRTQGHQHRV